jgi:hypothetical protein
MKGFLEMVEYNFEPDYSYWWNKKDLTVEELAVLIFGVTPNDYDRYIKDFDGSRRHINDNEAFITEMGKFIRKRDSAITVENIMRSRDYLVENNYWENDKHSFIKNVYEIGIAIRLPAHCHLLSMHQDFLDYLDSIGERPTHFDKYNDVSIYKLNTDKLTVNDISSEDEAISIIFEREPKYFYRFIKIISENKEIDKLSSEDRFFYMKYPDDYFGKHAIFNYYKRIKELALWNGDFRAYIQNLFNEGFIPSKDFINFLSTRDITLTYSPDSWAIKFYNDWIARSPVWNLSDAAKLYLGTCPYNKRDFFGFGTIDICSSGYQLYDSKSVFFLDKNGDLENIPNGRFKKDTCLKEFAKKHIELENLKAVSKEESGNYKFKPSEITLFFEKYCPNTYKPQALFDALGIIDDYSEEKIHHNTHSKAKENTEKFKPSKLSQEKEKEDITYKSVTFINEYQKKHAKFPNKPDVCEHLKTLGYGHLSTTSLEKKFIMKNLKEEYRKSQNSRKIR